MVPIENSLILKSTGLPMPLVGLGLWKVDKDKAAEVVVEALRTGYRLLDNGSDYGNEKEVGQGLQKAFDSGIVKREDIFVVSKLWNTFHSRENVRPALERTLKDLGLDYLDLYLIHFPISLKYVDPAIRYPPGWYYDPAVEKAVQENVTIRETWEAMEELVNAGLVKHIGLSNFCAPLIQDLLKYARIRPDVLEIEHHPYLTQEMLVQYAKSQNIALIGYSSFASQSYVELNWDKAINYPSPLKHNLITEIAQTYKKSPAQILLRWAVQREIAVIPKSNNLDRVIENKEIFDFSLTEEEINRILSLNINVRFNDPGEYMGPNFAIFA
ncbi:hypothetical protein G9A89_006557 [Geosiphon pyriformis]|nr:hypothetical protein G9A89_006557 [Geosiphon pyriformis]